MPQNRSLPTKTGQVGSSEMAFANHGSKTPSRGKLPVPRGETITYSSVGSSSSGTSGSSSPSAHTNSAELRRRYPIRCTARAECSRRVRRQRDGLRRQAQEACVRPLTCTLGKYLRQLEPTLQIQLGTYVFVSEAGLDQAAQAPNALPDVQWKSSSRWCRAPITSTSSGERISNRST
jgi:hypothetical protein